MVKLLKEIYIYDSIDTIYINEDKIDHILNLYLTLRKYNGIQIIIT